MRTIRFRGWHLYLRVMLYPPFPWDSMLDARPHTKITIQHPITAFSKMRQEGEVPKENDYTCEERNIPATMTWDGRLYINGNLQHIVFQQSTGKRDKNGKEIWEGDIIKTSWELNWVGKQELINSIYWSEKSLSFIGFQEIGDIEVIGNIYENEELLK